MTLDRFSGQELTRDFQSIQDDYRQEFNQIFSHAYQKHMKETCQCGGRDIIELMYMAFCHGITLLDTNAAMDKRLSELKAENKRLKRAQIGSDHWVNHGIRKGMKRAAEICRNQMKYADQEPESNGYGSACDDCESAICAKLEGK